MTFIGKQLQARMMRVRLSSSVVSFSVYLITAALICSLTFRDDISRADEGSQLADVAVRPRVYLKTQTAPPPQAGGLFNSWKSTYEDCDQWISAQRLSKSHIDVYIIGTQKGATSELSRRLYDLGVRRGGISMVKEWQVFNHLTSDGKHVSKAMSYAPFHSSDLKSLRLLHYRAGFPNETITTADSVPLVDDSPVSRRTIVYDSTVEYMHSDRTAFITHLLSPHARIVLTLRDPVDRALSQFNMITRTGNLKRRSTGQPQVRASPERFHDMIVKEIGVLRKCGYDPRTGEADMSTSQLQKCFFEKGGRPGLFVLRGLYHLHINAWRKYFPDHRMHFVLFKDALEGNPHMLQNLSKFLCVRPFPQHLLDKYKSSGSDKSFGIQNSLFGHSKGKDDYGGENRYLGQMLPETRTLLENFYEASNARLVAMLGTKPY